MVEERALPAGEPQMACSCNLSVVMPAYQEGNHIVHSVTVVIDEVRRLTADYELIIVDDGSTDETWDYLRSLHKQDGRVRGLRLSRNFGKEYALSAGLDAARGRAVLILDADLQHPPSLIPVFYELWQSGKADVVEGVKKQRADEPFTRRLCSRLFNFIAARATGINFTDSSDFKLLDRRAIDAWRMLPERRCFFRGMASWIGFRRSVVEFEVEPRHAGDSKWTLASLVRLAWSAITSYSVTPLRIIHIWAALFLGVAIWLSAQALYLKFTGRAFTGFTTVIILTLIVGGLVLMSLGIIAEYLAAIYEEIKSRPRYIISDEIR